LEEISGNVSILEKEATLDNGGLKVLNYETDTARMQTRKSSGKRGQRCFAAKQSI